MRIRKPEVHVRQPCDADWETMTVTRDDRVRFCASCQKDVHDLTAYTAVDGERLLAKSVGRICIIVERDEQGRMITADRPRRRLPTLAAAAVMSLAGCAKDPPAPPPPPAPAPSAVAVPTEIDASPPASPPPAVVDAATSARPKPSTAPPPTTTSHRRPGCWCRPNDPLCDCL